MSEKYVYVIAHLVDGQAVGPCKVGISANVQGRLSALQTGNPRRIVLYASYFCPGGLAELVEESIHDLNAVRCVGSEWFDMDPDIADKRVRLHIDALMRFMGFTREEIAEMASMIGLPPSALYGTAPTVTLQ